MNQLNKAVEPGWRKIPQLTLLFWIMKITATTFGETGGDLLAQTLGVGYAASTLIFFGFFLVMLTCQLLVKSYIPVIYWAVIVATSTAGTTMSDYMDRTLGLGYALGSLILVTMLLLILASWWRTEKNLSVSHIKTKKGNLFTGPLFSFQIHWEQRWVISWRMIQDLALAAVPY